MADVLRNDVVLDVIINSMYLKDANYAMMNMDWKLCSNYIEL